MSIACAVTVPCFDLLFPLTSSNFNFGEDTQVVLSEKQDGAYVYVSHSLDLINAHAASNPSLYFLHELANEGSYIL